MTISGEWVDPDDVPELGPEWFDKAAVKADGKIVKRGGRPKGSNKEQITLRLDHDIVEKFKAGGAGWQTRINDALRRARV
jgi:uncharacterized protein (DUF4415 family)